MRNALPGRRPTPRRGIAALELALVLPTMVALLALIFALASINLERTRAAIDGRHAAWRLGPPADAAPLRLAFDPRSELVEGRARRQPRVARPLRPLGRDVTAAVALLRGTWDTPSVPLDRLTGKPLLPHLEVLEQVVRGAAGVPDFDAAAGLTDFIGGEQGSAMAQVDGFGVGGSSLPLPGGGLGGLPLDQIKAGKAIPISLPGGGGGGGGFSPEKIVGDVAGAAMGGASFPGFDPGQMIDLGSLGGMTDAASEGLTETQKALMEAGRDLLTPVNETLKKLLDLDSIVMDAALKMIGSAAGGDFKKAINKIKDFEEKGLPTQRLIDASQGR